MPKGVYLGRRGAEFWFKGPAPRTSFQATGWNATTQQVNGRISGRKSRVTHMEYDLEWHAASFDEARFLDELYYNTHGDGLIYWIDPTVRNLVPAFWSQPEMGATDGPSLYTAGRPARVATPANTRGYPAFSARYTASANATRRYLYIPVPAGHTAHIGVHGVADAGIVVVRGVLGQTVVVPAALVPTTSVTSATRYTKTITRTGANISGVELYLAPGETIGGVTAPASGTIASICVEVLPTGTLPQGSSFLIGGGHSGCEMFEPPVRTPINVPRQLVSVSTHLTEVD